MPTIRVSAIQFAVTEDVNANLATALRMIDTAAQHKPHIIVTPEFINHILWFEDPDHCWRVSLDRDSEFLKAIGFKAKEHNCYIKVNVTLRREYPKITGTNILFDPGGAPIAFTDKQILMGNENNFLTPADEPAQVVQTSIGALGMYCCMDGVIPEPARALAVRGAQILLNSLNSFAHDEASLHVPVRSGENKVFVIAANKIGALVPPRMAQTVADRLKIPADAIAGAGESQIIAPDGTVLAKAPKQGEAAIFADIEVDAALNKRRPDGTDILASRRPPLYTPIAASPSPRRISAGADTAIAAVYQPASNDINEIIAVIQQNKDVQLIVLPELTFQPENLQTILKDSNTYIVTSIQQNDTHLGIILNKDGILLRQPQLHLCGRHPWATELGDQLEAIDLPFGRLAIVVGGDAIYPEVFRLAALQDVDVVAVTTQVLEDWEMTHGFLERSAENRMNLVVATQPSKSGTSALFALDKDFTLWTQWEKPFNGNINHPRVVRAPNAPGLTRAEIYPAQAANKVISQKTHLIENRPWRLAKGIITA
jgi:predicted amidohydrolase